MKFVNLEEEVYIYKIVQIVDILLLEFMPKICKVIGL